MNIIRGRQSKPQKVVIYGAEGVGKTTLAAGIKDSLLFDIEGGSWHIDCARVQIDSMQELIDTFRALAKDKAQGFKVVIIDTMDRVWDYCCDSVLSEERCKAQRPQEVTSIEQIPYGRGYVLASDKFCEFMQTVDKFQACTGIHVVMLAHTRVEVITPPDNESYTRYGIKLSQNNKGGLHAKDKLKEWVDAILFMNTPVAVKNGKAAGGTARVLNTTPRPAWEAKNRHGLSEQVDATPAVLEKILSL